MSSWSEPAFLVTEYIDLVVRTPGALPRLTVALLKWSPNPMRHLGIALRRRGMFVSKQVARSLFNA